jgi:NAD(P)-dependent dehydrogenase (short-subunit alcohol dehydrogenase family)
VRRRLLAAAGRVAHPDRAQHRALARAFRKQDRAAARAHDAAVIARTGMRVERRASWFVLPPPPDAAPADARTLKEPRDCYVCKQPFVEVHHFYDQLCPSCAALNWQKRHQSVPCDGRVAVVTGARIKIGYHITLKLLRAGATVVATSRFPRDAAARFAAEPDFAAWRDRLHVYGLDLRHTPSVELFAAHLTKSLGRLDLLVNNAAQTVRRPIHFYSHLLPREAAPLESLPEAERALLAAHTRLCRALAGEAAGVDVPALPAGGAAGLLRFAGAHLPVAAGLLDAPTLSQIIATPDDEASEAHAFPEGSYDGDAQQIDLRERNSWRQTLAEVTTPELIEVHLVNAVAPFVLTRTLRPLFLRTPGRDKHVIHVSAMEAQFNRRKKTERHPHTNMAKAALNMLTRTAAAEWAADGIYMNSVDTGWVTDEDPLIHVARKQEEHRFHPPLDSVDGAARVLDPWFTGLATGEHPYGLFWKDYRPTDW